MGNIGEMLNPKTVALIGASDREGSIGRTLLENLLKYKKGKIFPVNPNRETVLGLDCFSRMADIPEPVSLAVVATSMRTMAEITEECGQVGIHGMVIISASFRETDTEWKRQEERIIEIRKRYGMRIMGPNCMGIIRPHIGLCATFLKANPVPGRVAFISQSGILGDAILEWGADAGIGFSMFASLGSMVDVGFGDLIDFLSDDYDTTSIMIYMESVGDARRFVSAARGFCQSKPIIVLKPGYSAKSAGAIVSRTGSKIGEDRVYDAVFKRVGAVRVKKVADIFNAAKVLGSSHLPLGSRLAIVTNTRGVGIIATDNLFELGGQIAKLSDESIAALDSLLPEQWSRSNPIDMLGDADANRYSKTIDICADDPGVDGVLVICTPRAAADPLELAQIVADKSRRTGKPIIATWMGGRQAREERQFLLQNNVPAYETPEEAVATYLYMYSYHRNIQLLYETPAEVAITQPGLKNQLKELVHNAIQEKQSVLTFDQSMFILRSYGISVAGLFGTEIAVQQTPKELDYRVRLQAKRDEDFGSIILVGSEGKDRNDSSAMAIGLPPLNETLTRRLIEETDIYNDLHSDRPEHLALLEQLEKTILAFSNLIVDFPEIVEMELAPVAISGRNVTVLDARISIDLNYTESSQYPHLVIAPYPDRYTMHWSLPDGTEVLLRPIRPEDEPLGREMFAGLSEETLRTRFFSLLKITHEFLVKFCNIDYDRETAILAEIRKDGRRKIIGGVRFIVYPDLNKAEFAILVHDDYQRKGLAKKLMGVMIEIAQEKGLDEVYGTVLTDNHKIINLCRKLGFELNWLEQGVSKVTLTLKH